MPTLDIEPPVYRYFTTNLLTNTVLAEIPFQGVSYERALSAAGSFSGNIPVFADTDHLDLYNSTMPGQTGLYVVRNDVCVWGGIIWSRNYDIISKTLGISASEFPSYLQHRVIWGNFLYTKAAETAAPSGSNLIVTLPADDTFTAPVGSSVYLNFTQEALWDLSDFYTILSSPAPTSNTFAVSMPSFPNNKTVSNRSSSSGVATITTSAAHEFEEGMFVTISGVTIAGGQTNPFNGTFSVVNVPSSTTFTFGIKKNVTKRSVTASVATLTTSEAHGLAVSDSIVVADVGTGYDGTRTITAVTDTTVSFTATIETENEVTIAGEIYRSNISAGSPYTGGGTAKIRITNGETIAESDLQVTFRTDTYDYVRNFLREIFTDFTAVAGSNVELGVVPESNSLGKLQHSAEITNKALTNNVATITTSTRTKLFPGQRVTISNVDSTFNGTYTITAVNRTSNTISYAKTAANVASTAVTSSPISVTRRSLSDGVVTLTTSTNHGLVAGNKIKVSSVDPKWFKLSVYDSPVHEDKGETISEYLTVTAVPTANTISYRVGKKVQNKSKLTEADAWYLAEPNSRYSVARKKLSANVATVTVTEKHNLKIGDTVRITGMATVFNGTHTVTAVPTDRSFRFAKVAKNVVQQNSPGRVVATARVVASGSIDYSARALAYTYGPFPDKADIGITIQSGFSGVNYKPEDLYASELTTAKEHIDRYIAKTEGFDYRIDCTYNSGTGEFERAFVFVPVDLPSPPAFDQVSPISRFGADDIVFEYPGSISSLTIDESSEDAATRFFVMSSDSKNTGGLMFVGASDGRLLADDWPLLDMKEKQDWPVIDQNANRDKYTNINPVLDLTKTARRYLAESRPPTGSVSVSVNGSIAPEVGTYDPGDWCALVIDDEFVLQRLASDLELRDTALVRKIISYSVSVPDNPGAPEEVSLSLLPEWEVDEYGE